MDLKPEEKVAVLLLALGEEISAAIFQQLDKSDVVRIAQVMNRMRPVDQGTLNQVIKEFDSITSSKPLLATDLESILQRAFGKDATPLLKQIQKERRRFQWLVSFPCEQVIKILSKEQPRVIAAVLAHLPSDYVSQAIKFIPEPKRQDTVFFYGNS